MKVEVNNRGRRNIKINTINQHVSEWLICQRGNWKINLENVLVQIWWHTLAIITCWKLRSRDYKFEAILVGKARTCLKKQNNKNKKQTNKKPPEQILNKDGSISYSNNTRKGRHCKGCHRNGKNCKRPLWTIIHLLRELDELLDSCSLPRLNQRK